MGNQEDRWDAENYKKNATSQFQLGMNAIQSLSFRDDEIILDVGCGEGRLTREIAKLIPNGKILGIDVSQNMIQEARRAYSGVPNMMFECKDATTFKAQDRFDKVVSFNAFHWIEDQLTTLKNIYAMLKCGGSISILMVPSTKNLMSDVMESPKWEPLVKSTKAHFKGHIPETIVPLLEQSGFVGCTAFLERFESVFQNKKALLDWLMTWIPHATGLAPDKIPEILHDCAEVETLRDGMYVCEGDALHVKAYKSFLSK